MTMTLREMKVKYGDLAEHDTLVDKSGKHWIVVNPKPNGDTITFDLAYMDKATVPVHRISKSVAEEATVMRAPWFEQDVHEAKLKAQTDHIDTVVEPPSVEPTVEEAVEAVQEALPGAEVVAESTPQEDHTLQVATDLNIPAELPRFEKMSPMEQQSHLYLYHGVWSYDLDPRDPKVIDLHNEAHEPGRLVKPPHIHLKEAS